MSTDSPKTYSIKNYGCQMNVYDGERMAEMFESQGMTPADEKAHADLVVLNTCHIREKAAEKVYSEIGRLRRKDGSSPVIAVAGCVAQAEGGEISRRAPEVDIVVGPQAYHNLPEMVAAVGRGERVVDLDLPGLDKFGKLPARRKQAPSAFLTVQEGCDKFCAFCVVPYTRGAEVSRPAERVLKEARDLVERGVRDITLLGQNVNAYHGVGFDGDWGLARLLRELAKVDGLERLRYTTSHPRDMDDDLIAAHGDLDKLMPYLHLPVQSGSDRILKRMNRGHTAEDYLRLIERLRDARPDLLLSSDFIAAFPEETEAEFEETLDLIRTVNFGMAYTFKYSSRPGTPAAERPDVADEIGDDRLRRLQILCTSQQRAAQENMVGKEVGVLFEKPGRQPGQFVGKSDHLHAVHVTAEGIAPGDLRRVRVTASGTNSLAADLL